EILRLAHLDQLLLQLGFTFAVVCLDEEIADLSVWVVSGRRATVTIRVLQVLTRAPRHQQILEDALLDQRELLCFNALIIYLICPNQILTAEALSRWVIKDRHGRRKHRTI